MVLYVLHTYSVEAWILYWRIEKVIELKHWNKTKYSQQTRQGRNLHTRRCVQN